MSRSFTRPMSYDPSMGQAAIQRSLSLEDSKKKAAMDLGFDPEDLRDRGVDDDDEEDDDLDAAQPHGPPPRHPPPPMSHHSKHDTHSNGVPEMPTSPLSTASHHSSHDHDYTKMQTQLDLLKRVNAQLTKDKETLSKQLQHARAHGASGRTPSAGPAATHVDNKRVLHLLNDAEQYIATLRKSSCNYVNILRRERELYRQGAPTVVQQLQRELAEARSAGSSHSNNCRQPHDSVSSQDTSYWKEQCEKLTAALAVKDKDIRELQSEADRADSEAQEAEKDMALMAERLRAAESEAELLREQLANSRETAAVPSGDAAAAAAALAKRDARIEELANQLEAQRATMGTLNHLLKSRSDQEASEAKKAEALVVARKALAHQLKKLRKAQAALRADAAAFSDMVSPQGWSVLVSRAVETASIVQGKVEAAAVDRTRAQFAVEMETMEQRLGEVQEKWRKEHARRRALHNEVIELKGNIRVLCRVRPLSSKETSEGASSAMEVVDDDCVKVVNDKGAEKQFDFDRCFAAGDSQTEVYREVSSVVTSVMDGYNVCIMAYGQTGSGKTHTMEGPQSDPGVNARALQELFQIAAARGADFEISISTSVLEIYNEEVNDLLSGSRTPLSIRAQTDGLSPVDGLSIVQVESMEDVQKTLAAGQANRSTFATNMNEHSSRSHLVLSVYTSTTNRSTGGTMTGKLHLVDLAGSERLSKTGATGDRLKEAQNINKSLSALGDVVAALQQKQKHIPYRNSKLTHLLQDSLGGNSKVLMFVNCSPATTNASETLCSLNFASRASKVELGKAMQSPGGRSGMSPSPSSGQLK